MPGGFLDQLKQLAPYMMTGMGGRDPRLPVQPRGTAPQPVAPRPAQYDSLGPSAQVAHPMERDLSLQGLVSQVARANGGKISLGQLAALSDIALKTTPKQKMLTPKEMVTAEYADITRGMLEKSLAAIQADVAAGKINPVDAEEMGKNAWMKYKQDIAPVVGVDPYQQGLAEAMAQAQRDQEQ